MRLLLCLAFVAIVTPTLQQTDNSTPNSNSVISATVAPTARPRPSSPPSPPTSSTILDCPAFCPRIYRPVCAMVEGQLHTYANICFMRSDISCARRRGVSARYNIHLIRRRHCNARRRRRRRPSKVGLRPRPRPIRRKPGIVGN